NAPAIAEPTDLRLDLVGFAGQEETSKHLRRRARRRNGSACSRPGDALAFARERQTGETCLTTDAFGGELVERDGIAKARSARAGGAGQEAGRGLVGEARAHAGMG